MKWKEGKRVKRCPRCEMFTEKNEGCNHMTCITCKYQGGWLCEGPYTYGHYDSGKCAGHQFTKADNLEEIDNNIYNKNRMREYFGLHSIFKCFYEPIDDDSDFMIEEWYIRIIIILIFWLFGVIIYFIAIEFDYFDDKMILNNECAQKFENFLSL